LSYSLLKSALAETRFHVSPFIVLGDPTPELSVELAEAATREGASMLEIGFPYGDPVADGPAIQAADLRALQGGTSTEKAIGILARIREVAPEIPLNLLVYGNLVHARGYDRFCHDVVEAGASSLLVPDIPLEEGAALTKASRRAGLGHVELIGPLTGDDRLARIDRAADAFVYLVAHQGVTGARNEAFDAVSELVRRTSGRMSNPLCLGFGLSRPEHIRSAFGSGARIAVVGSHLARAIGKAWDEPAPDRQARVVESFVEALRPLVAVER
jgi:tryptophan synthase alpha chain